MRKFLSWLLRRNPYRTVRHVEPTPAKVDWQALAKRQQWITIDTEDQIKRVQAALAAKAQPPTWN